ncbi:AEC family transporter [Limisalsivibrio acetivorans]|uniref:AEC family transporter n=1 Tax=Limisalsivibrio acetivorans TaxID=1304888 RepID=UPI0003B4341B|nr:AEC family transporter [Limisalsivibrio acetivorans]
MPSYLDIFLITVPYFAIAGAGVFMRLKGWVGRKPEDFLLKLLIRFLIPCLIFNFVVGNVKLENVADAAFLPLWGFATIALGFVVAWFAAPVLGIKDTVDRRAYSFSLGVYNFGFFTIPIIASLYGSEAVGQLLVFNTGIDAAYWSLGVMILTGTPASDAWKILKSPPLQMIIVSLFINALWSDGWEPYILDAATGFFASIAIPVGLFISGLALGEALPSFGQGKSLRIITGSVVLRMFVLSVIFLLAARYIVEDPGLKIIIAVQSAMPAGMLNIAVTRYFTGRAHIAVKVVLGTTLVSIVTVPLWVRFAIWFTS